MPDKALNHCDDHLDFIRKATAPRPRCSAKSDFATVDLRDKEKLEQIREKLKTINPGEVAAR